MVRIPAGTHRVSTRVDTRVAGPVRNEGGFTISGFIIGVMSLYFDTNLPFTVQYSIRVTRTHCTLCTVRTHLATTVLHSFTRTKMSPGLLQYVSIPPILVLVRLFRYPYI